MHTVAVATGTRAEYGLLRPVLQKMPAGGLQPRLLVTGAHLAPRHGLTVRDIEADGFAIAARLDILSAPVPPGRMGTACRTALALRLFIDTLAAEAPEALLALGDRYEMLAAGQAAALLDIPVVHVSGGDVTCGADDDWFRHCLTKLAKLHFPSCEAYRRRIIRMGEAPGRVFNVGGLGDENIRSLPLPLPAEALTAAGIALAAPYALVTLHPQTAGGLPAGCLASRTLAALDAVPELNVLFTGSNSDAGGVEIDKIICDYCANRPNTVWVASLGTPYYLGLMRGAALVLGNSSSGVVETPSLGVPAVDVGTRQQGRVTGQNVLHCPAEAGAIEDAVRTALTPDFVRRARAAVSPYRGADTSGSIVRITSEFLASGRLRQPKVFHDGEVR
jgi:GDP/UDP-N,N'-diacetylbacillosamine 2-epimerase (hydrolysing)